MTTSRADVLAEIDVAVAAGSLPAVLAGFSEQQWEQVPYDVWTWPELHGCAVEVALTSTAAASSLLGLLPWRHDPDVLAGLAVHPAAEIRTEVATIPGLPHAAVHGLLADPQSQVRRAAAASRTLNRDPETLARLAYDTDPHVVAAVLWRSGRWARYVRIAPEAVFEVMAHRAQHGRVLLDGHLVVELAAHRSAAARTVVAAAAGCNPERDLTGDPDPRVRAAAAARPHRLAASSYRTLLNDPDPDVRTATGTGIRAGTNRDLLAELARHPDRDLRLALVEDDTTPSRPLRILAEDPDLAIAAAAVRHPGWTPPSNPDERYELRRLLCLDDELARARVVRATCVLADDETERLRRDPGPKVRAALATRPEIGVDTLIELAADPSRAVQRAAARAAARRDDLTVAQRGHLDTVAALAPDWAGEPGELIATARRLARPSATLRHATAAGTTPTAGTSPA